jgi:hypothetical protein
MANHANLVTVVVTGKLTGALTQAPASAATAKPLRPRSFPDSWALAGADHQDQVTPDHQPGRHDGVPARGHDERLDNTRHG